MRAAVIGIGWMGRSSMATDGQPHVVRLGFVITERMLKA